MISGSSSYTALKNRFYGSLELTIDESELVELKFCATIRSYLVVIVQNFRIDGSNVVASFLSLGSVKLHKDKKALS